MWGLLTLTLAVSGLMAAKQTFQGRVGPIELSLIILAGLSILAAGVPSKARWPWCLGLVVILVTCLVVGPFAPAPPRVELAVTAVLGGVYLLAGLPIVWPTVGTGRRRSWMLGSFGCFAVAAFVTPADPINMLLVAAPLCSCYLAVAIVGRKRRSSLRAIGLALLLAGSLIAFGSRHVLAYYWAATLLRIGVAVALLGAIAAIAGWSKRTEQATIPGSPS